MLWRGRRVRVLHPPSPPLSLCVCALQGDKRWAPLTARWRRCPGFNPGWLGCAAASADSDKVISSESLQWEEIRADHISTVRPWGGAGSTEGQRTGKNERLHLLVSKRSPVVSPLTPAHSNSEKYKSAAFTRRLPGVFAHSCRSAWPDFASCYRILSKTNEIIELKCLLGIGTGFLKLNWPESNLTLLPAAKTWRIKKRGKMFKK